MGLEKQNSSISRIMLQCSSNNLMPVEPTVTLHDESVLYPYFKNPLKIREIIEC